MESIKIINFAARVLFFSTGFLFFILGFLLKNNYFAHFAKMCIYILDLPFIFFAVTFFLTSLKLKTTDYHSITESLAAFFMLLLLAFLLFFHFAFPDLV